MNESYLLKKLQKFEFYVHPSLEESGISHGFGNNSLDILKEKTRFENIFTEEKQCAIRLLLLDQSHGTELICIDDKTLEAEVQSLYNQSARADGWISNAEVLKKHKIALGIKTADCASVLIFDKQNKNFALLHCGFLGAINDFVSLGIKALEKWGSKRKDLFAFLGPKARKCCYEIRSDMEEVFKKSESKEFKNVLISKDNSIFFDIEEVIIQQLINNDIISRNIYNIDKCTICDNSFFSYRREKEEAGRMLSFVL